MTIDQTNPLRRLQSDKLKVEVYADRQDMGRAAAHYAASHLRILALEKSNIRMVVGSAPSQDEFFAHLTQSPLVEQVDWSKVTVFHMDEYIGLDGQHPQSFRKYQEDHFISRIPVKAFHAIRGEAVDPEEECLRLEALLRESPIDLCCCGIGENGHLAFNDPPDMPVQLLLVFCHKQTVTFVFPIVL